jgi:hypothetical protein
MLDGFKFCHRCGRSIIVTAAAPDAAVTAAEPTAPLPVAAEKSPEFTAAEAAADAADEEVKEGGELSAGRVFLLELLCCIPIVNFFILAVMSSSRHENVLREYARGKLLASMTLLILFLLAALAVVLLLVFDVIEPIYLGRWRA